MRLPYVRRTVVLLTPSACLPACMRHQLLQHPSTPHAGAHLEQQHGGGGAQPWVHPRQLQAALQVGAQRRHLAQRLERDGGAGGAGGGELALHGG